MATWESQQITDSTPQVKFEASPTESLMSAPGDSYTSLFDTSTLNPLESVMTPQSCDSEDRLDAQTTQSTPSPAPENSEKKPVKKRKSWGQVLPEPKTNLPPRKRAKTEDEKEQRRVERVLRNRRAAQSSRERKRQEVEALELRNRQLEEQLQNQQKTNELLMDELNKLRGASGTSRGSSPLDGLQPSPPLTLSQPLFRVSQDSAAQDKPGMMNDFILMSEQDGTVDPASLSPEMTPVPDDIFPKSSAEEVATASTSAAISSDETQHPAAVLCGLQCPSVEVPQSWVASQQPSPPALSLFLQLQTLLTASSVMLSALRHPLTLIRGALKANLALHPTPSILSTIIWLVTRPPNSPTSTSNNSSVPTTSAALLQARPREATLSPKTTRNQILASSTLRIKSLRKLLTSSPILARPLKDATMELLRLVSEKGRDVRVEELDFGFLGIKGDQSRGPRMWPDGTSLPSREVLLTLLWAITVEERKLLLVGPSEATTASSAGSRLGSSSNVPEQQTESQPISSQNFVLSVTSKGERDMTELGGGKQIRLSP
ncbi:uncharacterized protein F4822DRAFT_425090 [Hypoxylon trugodes]|uniref:uncharacterized protein n=1 Tax=Hypoxylon trugodes TaxID=326681 RepID=UPI0021923C58|nr:uncharacterized protein F4822DRAFT_425090 [Hypoxylon trugodes]KAI1391868.1 hypothetical protein F4822DRAFT_425090 [Hypoxylon trugodes]